jgi:hypothetical protein
MEKYTKGDLRVVSDAVEHVRRDPRRYLGAENVTGENLAIRMMASLICLDAFPAKINRLASWWIVHSAKDWFGINGDADVMGNFSTIKPLPAGGRNAHRAEILLVAFADAVVTVDLKGLHWIKGSSGQFVLPPELELIAPGCGRLVAFCAKSGNPN